MALVTSAVVPIIYNGNIDVTNTARESLIKYDNAL